MLLRGRNFKIIWPQMYNILVFVSLCICLLLLLFPFFFCYSFLFFFFFCLFFFLISFFFSSYSLLYPSFSFPISFLLSLILPSFSDFICLFYIIISSCPCYLLQLQIYFFHILFFFFSSYSWLQPLPFSSDHVRLLHHFLMSLRPLTLFEIHFLIISKL